MKWMTISAAMFVAALTGSAATPPARTHVVHVKPMPESKILHKVMPQYSPEAADAHVHGTVKINVMIDKDGHVERIKLLSGHPLLAPAAMQAVRQWTFEPTQVDGAAVRVITEIDIPFDLNAHGLPVAPQAQVRGN
jgi:TonB family protein